MPDQGQPSEGIPGTFGTFTLVHTTTYQELLNCNHSKAHSFTEKWGRVCCNLCNIFCSRYEYEKSIPLCLFFLAANASKAYSYSHLGTKITQCCRRKILHDSTIFLYPCVLQKKNPPAYNGKNIFVAISQFWFRLTPTLQCGPPSWGSGQGGRDSLDDIAMTVHGLLWPLSTWGYGPAAF